MNERRFLKALKSNKGVSPTNEELKANGCFYAKFSARLNDPRSFWIFSCSSVMA
jgi:hypothetical protein